MIQLILYILSQSIIAKMEKSKLSVSFLDQDKQLTYKFTKLKTYRLIDSIRQHTEKLLTSNFINDHLSELQTPLFQYRVSDSYKSWTIVKRFEQFLKLQEELSIRYSDKLIPVPVENLEKMEDEELSQVLHFFQHFLNEVGQQELVREECFIKFVGSMVGQQLKQIKIYYQGTLSKRAGGRHNESSFKKLFNLLTAWEDRLVSITPQGIYLTQPDSLEVEDHLMFSSTFSFLYGEAATGYPYGIIINSSQRILSLDGQNIYNVSLFARFLSEALKDSQITEANRYLSFAPVRFACQAKYYIDGQDYFDNLCEAFLAAKKQIFITGWMISPYFSLRRPDFNGEHRLDSVLGRIAKAGIKINIILYNGPKMVLNTDSEFTQACLTKLSPNIKVLLHPNYVLIPFMWSHHEKIAVIDQKIAFIGGLDICYGRFDSKNHLLTDSKEQIWAGVDYCNYRISDILKPQQYSACSIDRLTNPRMPWHDIGVKLIGGSVQDLCRHFIQYWNYVNLQNDMNDRDLLMYVGIREEEIENTERELDENNLDGQNKETQKEDNEEDKCSLLNFFKTHKQKHQSICQVPSYLQSQQASKAYHSTQLTYEDENQIENQKEKQFYMNHIQEVSPFQNFVNMLKPKKLISQKLRASFEQVTLTQDSQPLKPSLKRAQNHQILRSASMWSIGLQAGKPQHSIWTAYLSLIENAKQFIYIENQFFISEHNGIVDALCKRIINAYQKRQKFKVVIMLPALPGFDGHPANHLSAVFRIQMSLIMQNVNKMFDQLLETLLTLEIVEKYFFVFSLRAHGLADGGVPVTEIIYIHSKIIIIDDRIVLIGSANINDRSLKGSRDTELAVVIEDQIEKQIETGEKKRKVSAFAHELRKELYMQHFRLTEKQAQDYLNEDIWILMLQTAKKNHEIYRLMFGCYPDDQMANFEDIQAKVKNADSSNYQAISMGIKSNAIPFQRRFLINQDFSLGPSQREYFVPMINFT